MRGLISFFLILGTTAEIQEHEWWMDVHHQENSELKEKFARIIKIETTLIDEHRRKSKRQDMIRLSESCFD